LADLGDRGRPLLLGKLLLLGVVVVAAAFVRPRLVNKS
jgi:hypothetical protein